MLNKQLALKKVANIHDNQWIHKHGFLLNQRDILEQAKRSEDKNIFLFSWC